MTNTNKTYEVRFYFQGVKWIPAVRAVEEKDGALYATFFDGSSVRATAGHWRVR